MSKRRVVVTGLGIVSPLGSAIPTVWQNILAGRSGIGPITRFDTEGFATRIQPTGAALAGLEDKFRPHFFGGVATVYAADDRHLSHR